MNQTAKEAAALVERLLKEIVLHPQDLGVIPAPMEHNIPLTIRCNVQDTGRIIGKGGQHFLACKAVARRIGQRNRVRLELEKLQNVRPSKQDGYKPFTAVVDWPRERIQKLVEDLARALFGSVVSVGSHDKDEVSTIFRVRIQTTDAEEEVAALAVAVAPLFTSIGICNGRVLYLDFSNATR